MSRHIFFHFRSSHLLLSEPLSDLLRPAGSFNNRNMQTVCVVVTSILAIRSIISRYAAHQFSMDNLLH